MKYTKIVSTIGPATDSKQRIAEIVEEGVDVIRQNFSHVDHEAHAEIYERVRDVSEKTAIMADTKGPEIRLGQVEEGTELETGGAVTLTVEKMEGNNEKLSVQYKDLINHLDVGDEVRIDDGKIELEVIEIEGDEAVCDVIYGGEVSSRKAVNVPGKDIGLQAPTDKDRRDIEFAAKKGYDFISLSFVKEARDIRETRKILEENGSNADIIAKIEHRKAIENFDEILEETDAVMVARGDLGVEMPASKLPKLQKDIIEKCNKAGKPVITATQMLESMTENPTATRAEISDVANAVLDGTDAVMLSGETAIGDYPVKTVRFMANIVDEVEEELDAREHHTSEERPTSTQEIICKNVFEASEDGEADYIVAHTHEGSTARQISKYRPSTPMIVFTDSEEVERQLQLVWGARPFYEEFPDHVDDMLESSTERLETLDLVDGNEKLVLTAALPASAPEVTNMMQIRETEELLE